VKPLKPIVDGWNRFWFKPIPTSTLALFRIALGLIVFGWALATVPMFYDIFGSSGVLPNHLSNQNAGIWGVLKFVDNDAAATVVLVVLTFASICLTIGYHTRIATVLVFIGILSLDRRNPFVFNAGDGVIRIFAFYMMFAPSGAALSVDRLRKKGREAFWEFPERAPWAMRLVQLQISVIYLSTVWIKLQGESWNDGTAVSYALRRGDYERLPVPSFLWDNLLVTNLLTYGTLATEVALGILLWNRKAFPYVVIAGISMHLFIDYSLEVGFFSFAMIAAYVTFASPEGASRVILKIRDRLQRLSKKSTASSA